MTPAVTVRDPSTPAVDPRQPTLGVGVRSDGSPARRVICYGDSVSEGLYASDEGGRWGMLVQRLLRGDTAPLRGYRPAWHTGSPAAFPNPTRTGSPAESFLGLGAFSLNLLAAGDGVTFDGVQGTSVDVWYGERTLGGALSVEIDGPLNPTHGYLGPLEVGEYVWCSSVTNCSTVSSAGTVEVIAHAEADDWTPAATMSIGGWQSSVRLEVGGVGSGFQNKLNMTIRSGASNRSAIPTAVTGWADGSGRWVRAVCDLSTDQVSYYYSDDPATTARASVAWTLIETVALSVGVSSIDSSASCVIGNQNTLLGLSPWVGKIRRHAGLIDGSLIWDVDLTTQLDGALFFMGVTGRRFVCSSVVLGGSPSPGFSAIHQDDPCGLFVTGYFSTAPQFVGNDNFVNVVLPDSDPHDIYVSYYADGVGFVTFPTVNGVLAYDGDEDGVHVWPAGHGGFKSFDMFGNGLDVRVGQQLELTGAGLAIFFFFFNEYAAPTPVAPATAIANLSIGVDAALEAGAQVLLVGGYKPGGVDKTYPWADYIAVLDAKAATDVRIRFLDLSDEWPQPGTAEGDATGWYADTVHLTDDGEVALAARIHAEIRPQGVAVLGGTDERPRITFDTDSIDAGLVMA